MASIKVNSKVMRDKANSLKTIANSIRAFTEEMTKEINSLKSSWEGQAAEVAVKKFSQLSNNFKEKYDTINQYAKFLENAAEQWDRTNQETIQATENQR
ncbi:WXG100 family type VII secretion target [Cytobacillus firmus]|uniref:WXG100 family type VII secretion target n=1 Tax=Cytobacillus firmus TaxID=1399 RepID=UPI002161BD30|nr:WXG100 family type VII secretion target [Cytobacillus firmus]MCS0674498.1 WXG100 family type VII secretion target [Cytobacillus firmus]